MLAPRRSIVQAALLVLAAPPVTQVAAAAQTATDLVVRVERIAGPADTLTADLAIDHLLDEPTRDGLERGVPMTLVVQIELWRERGAWFDRLEASRTLISKLQRDVWDEVYGIQHEDGSEEVYSTLDEAAAALEHRGPVAVAPLASLTDGHRYYLVATAALKPLTIEDVDELEGWLSGEIKTRRQRGFGILGLPKALFGLVLNVTGIRDRNDSMRTESFRRADLAAAPAGIQ